MKRINQYILIVMCCLCSFPAAAKKQTDENRKSQRVGIKDYTIGIIKAATVGMEFRLKAGIAIGGTAPLPIPLQIQGVEGFKPGINTSLEAEFVQDFNSPFGFSTGLRLETKGMTTNASVKNYGMSLSQGGQDISGYWWGMVETQVSNSYLTLPILFLWKPSERWDIKIGPYGSFVINRQFSGYAYNGYFRAGDPTGEKTVFEGDNKAPYDFHKNISRWDWGVQLAADWRAFPHLLVGLDLTWGMKDMFKKDFETIAFNMYPIFLRLNFGYAF